MNTVGEKGRAAKRLLNDPILLEAFEAARDDFIDEWVDGETVDERELAWAKTKALAAVISFLEARVIDLMVEEHETDNIT